MAVSRDPAKAAIQRANLRNAPAAPAGNGRAVVHGAFSTRVRDAREKHVVELVEAFPNATSPEIAIQAHRLAQLDLLGAFMDERGVIRHKRRGEVFPAASLMEKIAVSFERQHALLLERERTRPARPAETLASIIAELTAEATADQDGTQDDPRWSDEGTADQEHVPDPPQDAFDASDQGGA
jgi:hypothetical protein